MHITHALGHLLFAQWRLATATLVAAVCITLALALADSAPATANSPSTMPSLVDSQEAKVAPACEVDALATQDWFGSRAYHKSWDVNKTCDEIQQQAVGRCLDGSSYTVSSGKTRSDSIYHTRLSCRADETTTFGYVAGVMVDQETHRP
jgi:hypothetical protein